MAEKVAARNWVDPSALRSSAPMRSPIMDKHITEVIGGAGFWRWKVRFGSHSTVNCGLGNGLGSLQQAKGIPGDRMDPPSEVGAGRCSLSKILTGESSCGHFCASLLIRELGMNAQDATAWVADSSIVSARRGPSERCSV
jgi:hypothetical protein